MRNFCKLQISWMKETGENPWKDYWTNEARTGQQVAQVPQWEMSLVNTYKYLILKHALIPKTFGKL
jgi:hypothetical protein